MIRLLNHLDLVGIKSDERWLDLYFYLSVGEIHEE